LDSYKKGGKGRKGRSLETAKAERKPGFIGEGRFGKGGEKAQYLFAN